jgi:hypothetical protein
MQITAPGRATGGPTRNPAGSSTGSRPAASASRTRAMPSWAKNAPVKSGVNADASYTVPSSARAQGRSSPGGPSRIRCT